MHTHGHAGPPQPLGSSMSLAFVNMDDVPFDKLTGDMLKFEEAAAVVYALPPPLPLPLPMPMPRDAGHEFQPAQPLPMLQLGVMPAFKPPTAPVSRLRFTENKTFFSVARTRGIKLPATGLLPSKKRLGPVLPKNKKEALVLVRPRRVDGRVVSSFDVYIGQEWKRGGWDFTESETLRGAPAASAYVERIHWLAAYRDFAAQKMAQDPDFRATVCGLAGKKLGCWCVRPDLCHGQVLFSLIC